MSSGPTIEDVCLRIVDCEHKTAPVDPDGEYFAVGTPAMRGNAINYAESRKISKSTFVQWTRRMLPEPGDLLFAREAPVGPLVLIPDTGNVAPGQRTMLLRPDVKKIDSTFLFYLLTSPRQQELLLSKATGSTVAHLNVAEVRSFQLPELPLLAGQRAIAEVLGALDDKIVANAKLARSASDLAELEFRRLMLRSHESVTLAEVLTLEYGKSLPAGKRTNGPVKVYGSGGIVGKHTEALCDGPGVVVGRKGTAGAVHWASGPFFPIDTTFWAKPSAEWISPIFSYFLLKSLRLHEMNSDSAVPGLNRNEAHAIAVRRPDSDQLREFTTIAMELFDVTSQMDRENEMLATTRDTLLPQLMSGKLRVKEAEMLVEELV